MFYDLCYYVLIPLSCITGAAGIYYLTNPAKAKTIALNVSWDITQTYVTCYDNIENLLKNFINDEEDEVDSSDTDTDNEESNSFIFYNNEEHSCYITDKIDDTIMTQVNDQISPSIMFMRKSINDVFVYKRTKNPREDNQEYNKLDNKLFIQIEYVTKNNNGEEKVMDIHSCLNGFYVNGNVILDRLFLEWYLEQFYNISDVNDYELRIFDKDVNMFTITSEQSIKIENDKYTVMPRENDTLENNKKAEAEAIITANKAWEERLKEEDITRKKEIEKMKRQPNVEDETEKE